MNKEEKNIIKEKDLDKSKKNEKEISCLLNNKNINIKIEVKDLYKSFGEKKVLSGLSFSIKENFVTVIMGSNGQGKTTLLNCILTLIPIDSGEIYVDLKKVDKSLTKDMKKEICFMSDDPPFIEYLDGMDNLKYIAKIYKKDINIEKFKNILKEYELDPLSKTLVKNYSKGMKTKLSLCITDVIDANLVIFDEPTIGLDIITKNYLQKKILEFKNKGKTICITSHDTEFVSNVADEIHILNNKKMNLLLDVIQKEIIRNTDNLSKKLLDYIEKNTQTENEGEK